jgi:hypothetical protein
VVSEREKYNKPQGVSINYSSSNVPMTNIGDVDGLAQESGPFKTIGATYSPIKKRDYPAMRMVIACGSFKGIWNSVPAGSGFAIRRRPRWGSDLNGPLQTKNSGLLASKESK